MDAWRARRRGAAAARGRPHGFFFPCDGGFGDCETPWTRRLSNSLLRSAATTPVSILPKPRRLSTSSSCAPGAAATATNAAAGGGSIRRDSVTAVAAAPQLQARATRNLWGSIFLRDIGKGGD
uniref:Uncharacterized protein n=1 Tax=Oryza glumipatula TaxID=40148 RepID=A0A0D9Y7Q0_9ORYZ